jgi:hypothetical protein
LKLIEGRGFIAEHLAEEARYGASSDTGDSTRRF